MKRKIPFDLFGEKEELCFTIAGIAELERALGRSVQQIAQSGNAGVEFCLTALPICLRRINPHLYVEKIENYLDKEGNTIDGIAIPIVHALAASGVLGKTVANNALRIYYPELYLEPKETKEKNE